MAQRPSEAIVGLKTPVNPPAPTQVPLDQTVAPIDYEGAAKHNPGCPCEACIPYLEAEKRTAPELIETLHGAGYWLPSIIAAIGAGDLGLLKHTGIDAWSRRPVPQPLLDETLRAQTPNPPPPPPPVPGLGHPETTRKEAWWERAITWLLSRGGH